MIAKVGDNDREHNKSANVTSWTSNEETGPYHVQLAVQSKVFGKTQKTIGTMKQNHIYIYIYIDYIDIDKQ